MIRKALTVPGYLGVQMIRPQAGHQDYRAVVKFRTPEEWESFQQALDYVDFFAQVRPLLAVEPRVETACGLESWFSLEQSGRGGRGQNGEAWCLWNHLRISEIVARTKALLTDID